MTKASDYLSVTVAWVSRVFEYARDRSPWTLALVLLIPSIVAASGILRPDTLVLRGGADLAKSRSQNLLNPEPNHDLP